MSRPRPLLILANRSARALFRIGIRGALRSYARAAGFEPEVVNVRGRRHLQSVLRQRVVGRLPMVAIAGGDGTIHTAIQVLAKTDVTLGILPQGTANNFAAALRLPKDLPSAFRVLADGEVRSVDLGEAQGEYFAEAAGVGLFADVLAITRAGHDLRHILRGIRVILGTLLVNRPRRLTLTIDGEPHQEEALNVTVANSFSVGYNLPIAPTARVTDARLDVVVVGHLDRREMLTYYRALRAQSHLELPKVHLYHGSTVEIGARRSNVVHLDDRVRWRTPITVRVVPKALRVMVDRL
jgi:diacylglycerol kinase (ATP)